MSPSIKDWMRQLRTECTGTHDHRWSEVWQYWICNRCLHTVTRAEILLAPRRRLNE